MAHDSPFYRVSVKALIFDHAGRLLVFQDKESAWEMPGGGWEHGETLEACITRELYEEMRIVPATVGPVSFIYTGEHEDGYQKLCIAVPVSTETTDFVPTDDDLVAAKHVTREEFLELPFGPNEVAVLQCVEQIWPATT